MEFGIAAWIHGIQARKAKFKVSDLLKIQKFFKDMQRYLGMMFETFEK